MPKKVTSLFNGKPRPVGEILAGFEAAIEELKARAELEKAESQRKVDEAERLYDEAADHDIQADRARDIAARLEDLIS